MGLEERIDDFAAALRRREAGHAEDVAGARLKAQEVHRIISNAIARFNAAIEAELPALRIEVSAPRLDDKHVHAVEFNLSRGRHRAIVTTKSKGEITLVGPFKAGKNEGPCRTFPFSEDEELKDALGDFIERFLEEATAP